MKRLLVLAVIAGCGGKSSPRVPVSEAAAPATTAERILALLPQGPQIVVELDLARLRANPVVGPVVARVLADDSGLVLPGGVGEVGTPLATADLVVLAAYGVGTSEAATVTVVAAPGAIAGATRLLDGIYGLGPAEWIAQLEERAMLSQTAGPIRAQPELLALRDHAMPAGAPGASLRITARLPFDARISLARQTGLESAPAQLSVWADVVEDFAVIVDADATDPGDKRAKQATARLQGMIRGALAALAGDATARALGLPKGLANARLVTRGTWVRTIIAIGPEYLKRVVERANALLPAAAPVVKENAS
ncbi:MAG: hypothetical protein ACTHU0_11695 [Kofleriaceae bacterium]